MLLGDILFRMYLWWSLWYLLTHQVKVTVDDLGLCCCVCVTCFKPCLTPLLLFLFSTGALGLVLFQTATIHSEAIM